MSLRHGLLRSVREAEFEDDATVSTAVHCNGLILAGIVVPTGWVAGDLTFQGSVDGTNFFVVYDDNATTPAIRTIADATAERYITITDPAVFSGLQRLKAVAENAQTGGPISLQLVFID